ncbi:MAG: hypothetical protein JWP55_1032 [Mycobacterium sp.]|nr:hypothetical protein [Mycobacterium sp.]
MRCRIKGLAAATVAAAVTVGCSQTVTGDAHRARPSVPDPDRSYGYVDDRCGLLADDSIRQALDAESVVRPYSGAVCQYVLAKKSGLVDVVFSWFETGSFDRERGLATQRGATITDTDVERHPAFLAEVRGGHAACSATAAAGTGVLTWWVQFRPMTGGEPCQAAQKLLAATLSSDL